MKSTILETCIFGLMLVAASQLTLAEDQKKETEALPPAVVEQLSIANKLIALGDARKDPLLLIAAAKLQKSVGAETSTMPTQSNASKDVLARARKLAAGNKDLIGLIDDIAAMRSKRYSNDCNGFNQSTPCTPNISY